MVEGDFGGALAKINEQNPFPGICGRVCQHELYCESACLLGSPKTKLEPVAIGSLERFVADWSRRRPGGCKGGGMNRVYGQVGR